MAPEQAQGAAVIASDIYSLGVVAYEMLAGRPPFVGTATSVIVQHATTPPTPLNHYDPAVPSGVSDAILKSLDKNPLGRFSSALELAQTFQEALKEFRQSTEAPTMAVNPTSTPPSVTVHPPTPVPIGTTPHNLPRDLTSFVGRGRELDQIIQLLTDASTNRCLLALTGPGDTGKTRLAIQATERSLYLYTHGVWLVELAALSNPEL